MLLRKIIAAWLLSYLYSSSAHSDISISPDKSVNIETNCRSGRLCSTVILSAGKVYQALDSIDEPKIDWVSPSVAKIKYRCGSPCQIEQYFSASNGLSAPVTDPVVSNFKLNCSVSVDETAVIVGDIYGTGRKSFGYDKLKKRPYQSAAMISVFFKEQSEIKPNGDVLIFYQDQANKRVSVVIPFACKNKP